MTDLFEIGAFRNSDPNTSQEAAESIDATRLEAIVYQAHKKAGDRGLTWDEATEATGLDKASVSPRFAPMIRKKILRIKTDEEGKAVKRGTGHSGRNQLVRVVC